MPGHHRPHGRRGSGPSERLWRARNDIAPDEQDWADEDQDDEEEWPRG